MSDLEYRAIIAFLVLCLGFFIVREFTLKDKALTKMEDMGKLLTQFEVIAAETKTIIADMRMWATDRFAARDSSETSIKNLWEADTITRNNFYRDVKQLREDMDLQMKELRAFMAKKLPDEKG